MPYYSRSEYNFMRFEKSKKEGKKYDAILTRKGSGGRELRVPFGDKDYSQYKDTSGLGLYSHLDHLDSARRTAYKIRHAKDVRSDSAGKMYSPGYFALSVLWT
tara:strand:- start:3102 stop:3410 length:309 start_codon:yes stop_codon:yes gene_type:complete